MRDRLIDLLSQADFDYEEECAMCGEDGYKSVPLLEDFFADYLLSNGVIVLPCKVGDTVFRVDTDPEIEPEDKYIEPYTIENIVICKDGVLLKYDSYDGVICYLDNLINGTKHLDFYRVFLSKEEAEQALKECENNA